MQSQFERFYPDKIIKKICDAKEVLSLRLVENTDSSGDYVVYIDRLFTSVRLNKDFISSPSGFGFCGYPGNSYYSDLIAKYPDGLKFNMQMDDDNFLEERKCLPLDLVEKIITSDARSSLDDGSYIYLSKVSEKLPWVFLYDPKKEYFIEYLFDFKNGKIVTSDTNNVGAHPVLTQEVGFVLNDKCAFKYEGGAIKNINFWDRLKILFGAK